MIFFLERLRTVSSKLFIFTILSFGFLSVAISPNDSWAEQKAGGAKKARPPVVVEVEAAKTFELEQKIATIGNLLAERTIVIRPEVTGRVKDIFFLDGDSVNAGDVIMTLDDKVARAELAMAGAKAKLSEAEYKRAKQLFNKKVSSGHDKDKAYAQWQVDIAEKDLQQAKLDQLSLKAPFSGVVGLMKVSPGDYLNPGRDIVLLVALDPMIIDFSVPENYLAQLKVGQPFTIEVGPFPGKVFNGNIQAIEPHVDLQSRSVLVRGSVKNPEQLLKPGLFAEVELTMDKRAAAIMIPEEALIPEGKSFFVYTLDQEHKADKKQVTIGYRKDGRVEIVSGLELDTLVVTAGHFKLRPGSATRPRNLQATDNNLSKK